MFYSENIKKLFNLALPMIIGHLGIMLVGVTDVFVAGRHSTDTLASIAIANSLLMNIFIFGISLLTAISPLLSNFRGEKIPIKKYFVPTLEFSMIMAIVICSVSIAIIPLVDILGFEENLIPEIKKYMFVCSFSNFGVYLFVSLKEYLQAFEIVVFPNLLNIFCVFLNLYLNFIFVFGWYGLEPMGAVGLAWATVVSRMIVGLFLLFYCLKIMKIRYYKDYSYFGKVIKMGLPISFAVLLEMVAWNIITIFVAKISSIYAAVQSIIVTLTNVSFMIPMAISNAVSVKVGFENGAKNYCELKKYAKSGIGICVLIMSFWAIIFLTLPKYCIGAFTNDTNVITIATPVMMLVGLFQIFDGLQVSIGGVFKGLKNTKIIMYGMFLAYWAVGLPLGCLFAFVFHKDLIGFWVGITIAIASLGSGLLIALNKNLRELNKENHLQIT